MHSRAFDSLSQLIPSMGTLATDVLGLCACLIYLSRTRKRPAAGGLMLAGMVLFLLVSSASLLWQLYMFGNAIHPRSVEGVQWFFLVLRMVGLAGSFLFYIGLLLMALRTPVQEPDDPGTGGQGGLPPERFN